MEIKTTEDIMYEYVDEEDHCLKLYNIEANVQWVRVDDIKKELEVFIEEKLSEGYEEDIVRDFVKYLFVPKPKDDMKKKIEIIERIVRKLEKLKKCKEEVKK